MEEVFRSGRLEMSADPLGTLPPDAAWSGILTNRILIVVATLLLLFALLDFFRLIPYLLFSYGRTRGATNLEHNLGIARTRDTAALLLMLPYSLLADRFELTGARFRELVPPEWSAPATLGLLAAIVLVRLLLTNALPHRRIHGEQAATLQHNAYNYFIALVLLCLVSTGLLGIFHVPEGTVRNVLIWETAAAWLFAFFRSAQFLNSFGYGFSTFLYLCGLEIIPAALTVAVVILF